MALRPNLENVPFSKSSSNTPNLQIDFLTIFPDFVRRGFNFSLLLKAQQKGLARLSAHDIRTFAEDKHQSVDAPQFGGGAGMVMRPDVLSRALRTVRRKTSRVILMSPQGQKLTQPRAKELAAHADLVLICGHYEGIDERFIDKHVDEEISIGDYVLTGGELPALVVADVVTRLVPGVVGKTESLRVDSLENGLLKHPVYTKPREFEGSEVPPVLLGGDHGKIARWRQEQSRSRTRNKRPDLAGH